jgi:iron(III) transport system permease protein
VRALAQRAPRRLQLEGAGPATLYGVVFVVVAGLILAPILFLIVNSFQLASPGRPAVWGLREWQTALGNAAVWVAVWNSIRIYLATSIIAWPVAIVLAWLIARTDLPKKNGIEFLFWLAFFLPSLTVVMGWVTLLDPSSGLFNQLIRALPFVHLTGGPFNVYTFWGLVWVHLTQSGISIVTILLIPAFRNLDAAMEEASRLSGASLFRTLRRVVLPLMGPAMIVTALLGFVRLWQSFEIELVLGVPQRFYVYGTKIYDLLNAEIPQYGQATVLAVVVIAITLPFMIAQRRYTVGKNYETITGRSRFSPTPLGRAKWPAFVVAMGLALLFSLTPMLAVTIATFMKVFGHVEIAQPWTLGNWAQVLGDPQFGQALRNTLLIAGSAALLGVSLSVLVAYIVVRTQFRLRSLLDVISWLPFALPGMLMGLGSVWIVLSFVKPLYGSIALLVIVTVICGLTGGVQIIKGNMVQLGTELEEASRLSGASWLRSMWRVVLPPLAPVLALVATLNFVAASRDVSNIILLASGKSTTLALLQLNYMVGPAWESAAVVSVVMTLITTGVALFARTFESRLRMS